MSSMTGSRGMANATGSTQSRGNKLAGYDLQQIQNYTPEQMQLFQSALGNVGPNSYTSRLAGGDESLFNEMEAPAFRQFNALQGGLASRFSGMGTGARKSSGFQNTASQASSDFAQDLQSRRQGLMQQAIRELHGMSSDLLDKRPYETFATEKERPWWEKLLGGTAPIAGAAIGGMYGGLPGAQLGGKIGASASQGFFG